MRAFDQRSLHLSFAVLATVWMAAPAAAFVAEGPASIPGGACEPYAPTASVRVTIGFDPLPPAGKIPSLAWIASGLAKVVRVDRSLHFVTVQTEDPFTLFECLRQQPGVTYVERTPTYHVLSRSSSLPDDPLLVDGEQYAPALVGAPAAWRTTRGGPGVLVCFVDTGIWDSHEDLAGDRYVGGIDITTGLPTAPDDDGHGTHVAGIAVATSDNGLGVAGISQAKFAMAKAFDAQGTGYGDNLASGIRWCADEGADVISLSVGGMPDPSVETAVDYAWARGSLLVAAAGNANGPDCHDDCVEYPAAYPHVLAVGCVDEKLRVCDFSSRGPQVALVAPGKDIISTWNLQEDAYRVLDGTSMSAPLVAGAAALLKSAHPGWDNVLLAKAIEGSARPLPHEDDPHATGHGSLRIDAALAASPQHEPRPDSSFSLREQDGLTRANASWWDDAATYLWDWGDGDTSGGANATHAYEANGTYSVALTVTSASGERSTTSRTIDADPGNACGLPVVPCVPPGLVEASPVTVETTSSYEPDPVDCGDVGNGSSSSGAVHARCAVTPPYHDSDRPDELEANASPTGASCGASAASVSYSHDERPTSQAVPGACAPQPRDVRAPADPTQDLGGVPAAPQPPGAAENPQAPSSTTDATPRAPSAPGLPSAPSPPGVEAPSADAAARFYRPVDDNGTPSSAFRQAPVTSVRAEVDGPLTLQARYQWGAPSRQGQDLGGIVRADRTHAYGAATASGGTTAGPLRAQPNDGSGSARGDRDRASTPSAGSHGLVVSGRPALPRFVTPTIQALGVGAALLVLAAALYHRIRASKLHEHPHREAIIRMLREHPGLTVTEMAARLALHPTSVAHHARRLAQADVLTSRVVKGRTRYAVAGTGPDVERHVLLRSPLASGLLARVSADPGVTIGEAATMLGASRFAVRLQVERLLEAAVIRVEADGPSRRLYPA